MQRSDSLPVLKTLARMQDPFFVNGYIPWILSADLSEHLNEAVVPIEVFTTTRAGLAELINGILSTGEAVSVEVHKTFPNDDSEAASDATGDDDDVDQYPGTSDDELSAVGKNMRYWGRRMHNLYDKHLTGEWIVSLKKTGRSEEQPYYVVRQLKKGTEISAIGNIPVANIHSLFIDSSGEFTAFDKEDEEQVKGGKFVLKNEAIAVSPIMAKFKDIFTSQDVHRNRNGELVVDYTLSKFR